MRPHYYCLPVLKRETHRLALVEAATGGNPRFFLGTDSAPHPAHLKEHASGCAGCYTAHAALELYAEAFDAAGALDKLEGFASFHGPTSTACRATAARSPFAGSRGTRPSSLPLVTPSSSRCAGANPFSGAWLERAGAGCAAWRAGLRCTLVCTAQGRHPGVSQVLAWPAAHRCAGRRRRNAPASARRAVPRFVALRPWPGLAKPTRPSWPSRQGADPRQPARLLQRPVLAALSQDEAPPQPAPGRTHLKGWRAARARPGA